MLRCAALAWPDGGSDLVYVKVRMGSAPLVKFRQIRHVKVWARRGPTLDMPSNSGLSKRPPERGGLYSGTVQLAVPCTTTVDDYSTVHMHI